MPPKQVIFIPGNEILMKILVYRSRGDSFFEADASFQTKHNDSTFFLNILRSTVRTGVSIV